MKSFLKVIATAVPLMAASLAFGSGIANSPHDFSKASWSDNEICKPCHTPHNAASGTLTGRLWSHTLSAESTQYLYHGTRGSGDGAVTTDTAATVGITEFDTATRLCLSCHDGTVALDSFMGRNGDSDGMKIGADDTSVLTGGHGKATSNLGGTGASADLSNDHPVGYRAVYDENAGMNLTTGVGHYRYKSLANAKTVITGAKFAISKTPVSAATARDSGAAVTGNAPAISCVTCHDVHNGAGIDEGLLRIENTNSAMCLACHDK